jgi:hypothetical protein
MTERIYRYPKVVTLIDGSIIETVKTRKYIPKNVVSIRTITNEIKELDNEKRAEILEYIKSLKPKKQIIVTKKN